MHRSHHIVAFALLAALLLGLRANAQPRRPQPRPSECRHMGGPCARVGRGIKNIVLSPFEVPATMRRVAHERDPFLGLWAGGLEGLGNGISRLTAGAIELVLAPLPGKTLP
ncbi:MAG: hypothetical protein ACODAJ_12625, partial [Planctomycetota bacterium]